MTSLARPVAVRWLLVAFAAASAWASALNVVGEPTVTGSSGDYVTLGFRLVGQGEYSYSVTTPEGWEPLNRAGKVVVNGDGFVSVTLKVPRSAPALGTATVEIAFINPADPSDSARGRGLVNVAAFVGLDIIAPTDLVGELGEVMELSVLVTNRGNLPDVVSLSADGGMWDVRFESLEIALEPGEQREVAIVMVPTGSVTSGYRHVLRVTATSSNDPTVTVRAFTESVFVDSEVAASRSTASEDPRLIMAVRSGVTAGITFDESGVTPSLRYDVNPRLTGALSDYVDVSAGVGTFAGSIVDPFEETPSRLDIGLNAESWDAAGSVSQGSYALSGGGLVGGWRLGGGASYLEREGGSLFGVTTSAVSQVPGLDLQFVGRTTASHGSRSDTIGARYRTPLGESLLLTFGVDLLGTAGDGGYRVAVGVSESLTYQAQAFDVTQSYSGVPQVGVHNLGLSGGLRSAGPFGVRASTSIQFDPSSYRWRSSLTVSASPLPGVGMSVTGSYQTGSDDATWSVRPSLSVRYRVAGVSGSLGVSYAHTGVLRGDLATTDLYAISSSMNIAAVTLRASSNYLNTSATSTEPGGALFTVSAGAEYRLGTRSLLGSTYMYESDAVAGEGNTTASVSWSHAWSPRFNSRLSYVREQSTAYGSGEYDQTERVALIGQVDDLWLDGLTLSAGYALGSDTGLLAGVSPLTHDVSVRVGYTLALPFDTPDALVQFFGGRRGGEISGVAYMDRDLDGVRSQDEEVLPGLRVQLGGESAVTGADGTYRIRAPKGTHGWSFGTGLPALVEFTVDGSVQVDENSAQVIDLSFVPVVSVSVTLFDDVDNDGVRGAEEGGISFGGVVFDGPVHRAVRVDGRGSTTVSGLVPGRYLVTPDPSALPARYLATSEPFELNVREGDRPAPIQIGAGAPPRQVVTTFTSANLAIIGRTDTTTAVQGAEIVVTALVSGGPERVTAELGGVVVDLVEEAGRWTGVLVVPHDMAVGRAAVVIRATSSEVAATAEVPLTVVASDE